MDAVKREAHSVNWWMRFALWASLLFPLAWLGLDGWHTLLAPCVSLGISRLGFAFEVQKLDLLAPYDIAFFLAMVLATTQASRRERLGAAMLGVPMPIVAEIVFATLATWLFLKGEVGRPPPAAAIALREAIAGSFPWTTPPIAWIALLGHHAAWPRPRSSTRIRRALRTNASEK